MELHVLIKQNKKLVGLSNKFIVFIIVMLYNKLNGVMKKCLTSGTIFRPNE